MQIYPSVVVVLVLAAAGGPGVALPTVSAFQNARALTPKRLAIGRHETKSYGSGGHDATCGGSTDKGADAPK